jgi:tRNA(Ser,Leu) C12 N-acetylase TAN1
VGYHCSQPEGLTPASIKNVKVRGIPYLAKNERDMGHPRLVVVIEVLNDFTGLSLQI